MNNFGVIEVASTRTTHAPGWAYVTDAAGPSNPSKSVSAVHLHVNRNKRAARQGATGSFSAAHHSDVSARHDARLQKEIEQLQRDSLGAGGAAQIPIPGGGGRDRDGKIRGHTPNVRRILASQKTFANHLDDFEAWKRSGHTSACSCGWGRSTNNSRKPSVPTPAPDPDVTMTDAPPPLPTQSEDNAQPDAAAAAAAAAIPTPAEPESKILTPFTRFTPAAHPGDSDPLLESWLPPLPTDDELRELMRAPPLSYNQARGTWGEDDTQYPTRHFCEVCGYWGRVRCMKCGTRVCALDCLDLHREECITRYGL
ncbi:hypothetical protein M406DRAFT_63359 [Cryphonectria parasitica EP155]|uniref:HIT-type domain-containing protein n=1 Tax=Cryphonectria parasitica (strain ATCC 38755 / EP155) TaxID=660469 RepID=A0A9P4XWS6_CRYP1|nr:uncharacterized protein M406DRAFT_63359 [Cryphonectria parasitica EP155]KAF3762448.1 hypothetical protein M406DRAFT_63359 [Cryphonectria parasitica EP155]